MAALLEDFWRLDTPVMDEAGERVIKGGMWPKQREWWELPNFIRLLVGGYGSGKTMPLCKRMISNALLNAPCLCAIVSPTYRMAQDTIVETVEYLLAGKKTHFPNFKYHYNQTKQIFYIEWGKRRGRLRIYSGEDPTKLKGPNLAAVGIDEPFIQDEQVFHQMSYRTRHPDAKRREINLAGTPEQLNWGYELAEGEMADDYDVGVVTISTRENLALNNASIGYVDRLERSMDDRYAQAFIEGKFVNLTKGAIYYAFSRAENVVELPTPQNAVLGAGLDFNVDPMAGAVFWTQGKHIHFFDEIELPNSDTEEMGLVLRENYPSLRDIFPDANAGRHTNAPGGKTDYNILEGMGYTLHKGTQNPPVRERFAATNAKLRPAREGVITCTISPRCKKLIKYALTVTHEGKNTDAQKPMIHLLDAFSYPIYNLFPMDRAWSGLTKLRGHRARAG